VNVVHFSDVHVQLPNWRARRLRELGALRSLATVELWQGRGRAYDDAADKLALLARRGLDAGAAICTGDLTQLGHDEEFAIARRALGALAARFVALPGNHDRFLWNGAGPLFERHFPEQSQSDLPGPLRVRLLGGEVAVVALDTAPVPSWPVYCRGRLSRRTLDDLAALLPSLRQRCTLVALHHAPRVRNGRPDWPWHGVQNGGELLRVCAEGGVQAVLCGHVHDRFDLPAAPGRARLLCAGSSTERGREGYWDLTIEGRRLLRAEARGI